MVLTVNLPAEPLGLSCCNFMWVRKQLGGFGRVPVANYSDPDIRQFRSSPQRRGNCGRPRKWNHNEICEAVKLVPLFQRLEPSGTLLPVALGIPKSTVHAMKCDKDNPVIIPCTSALKPALTEQHKLLQACYCVSKIDPATRLCSDFYEVVHVDEK
jgi:hypothetical protein